VCCIGSRILDGREEEYDEEIFDDSDFYQHLLREIISGGLGNVGCMNDIPSRAVLCSRLRGMNRIMC